MPLVSGWIIALLVAGPCCAGNAQTASTPGVSADSATERYLERIQAARSGNNVKLLREIASEIELHWKEKNDIGYYRAIDALCVALINTPPVTPFNESLARSLALRAYEASGEKPLEFEIKLVEFLRGQPDYDSGILHGEAWASERRKRVARWLKVWQRLRTAQAKLPIITERLSPLVAPPKATGFGPGIDPAEIEDPTLRREYEDSIAKNEEKYRIKDESNVLHLHELSLRFPTQHYFVDAYTNPPYNTEELKRLLNGSAIDRDIQVAIIKEVEQYIAAHEAQRISLEKLKKMESVPPPPANATAWQLDPRLQVRLSFDMTAPLVDEVLGKLRETTGVAFARSDDIQNKMPASGSLSYRGVRAWRIMNDLAASKKVEGQWSVDGDGYRIASNGTPVLVDAPGESKSAELPTPRQLPRYATIGGGVLLLMITGIFCYHMRNKRKKAATN